MKQKFRNGRRVDPADAKEKEKENSQPNLVDGVSEPPAKKQRKSTAKSRIASEGMCYVMSHIIKAQYMLVLQRMFERSKVTLGLTTFGG